jgi:hypothetical protein
MRDGDSSTLVLGAFATDEDATVLDDGDGWSADGLYEDDIEPDAAALEELTAVAASEAEALEASHAALSEERARTRAVLERYRELLLAAEPGLPGELVQGDTLEEIDAAVVVARAALADARAALGGGPAIERGFPVGAPARERSTTAGLSASEKIRRGLEDRLHGR